VLSQRYLCLIGFLVLAINLVNTNGEYILGKTLSVLADRNIAAGLAGAANAGDYKKQFIGSFYAGYFGWVNLATALIQLFLVSRIIKWAGVRVALFLMPIIAFGGYAMLALAPMLGMVRIVKIAENSLDYSLQNTARQALFLPTSRDAKYKAKAAIDTFFVRSGDVLSALTVFVGTKLALGPQQFAGINVALVLAWLAVLIGVAAEHRRLTESAKAPA
jgi:AAA family ATP:ADP antiporter